MTRFWYFVTDFGDSAITVPLAALAVAALFLARERGFLRGWVIAIGGCAVTIAGLKLVFGACGSRLGLFGIVSPSGHTAMSTVVYGALALTVGAALPIWARRGTMLAAALLIAGIAVSRVILHRHATAEVVLGLGVGLAAVGVFHLLTRRHSLRAAPVVSILAAAAVVFVAMHGTRWIVEPVVHLVAGGFRMALPWCQ